MRIPFHKYQATGNDFVVIDNREGTYHFSADEIRHICDRRFGVGADGVLLIEKHPSLDFNLDYLNPDGSRSLCANGSRAALVMASTLGMVNGKGRFHAYDGEHEAEITAGEVRLKMNDVAGISMRGDDFLINTGSPHFINFVKDLEHYPVVEKGRAIRFSDPFKKEGINVNFVEMLPDNQLAIRTYERGVEDETLSCGTGVTAAALASSFKGLKSPVAIRARGGRLTVSFNRSASHAGDRQSVAFHDIFLTGPAKKVYEGQLDL